MGAPAYDTVEKKIPSSQGTFWRCTINDVTYEYKAGETVDVPDFVGAIIDNELRQRPTYDDPTVRLTTEISEASTDKEVPSAKAVMNAINNKASCGVEYIKFDNANETCEKTVNEIFAIIESGKQPILYSKSEGGEAYYFNLEGYWKPDDEHIQLSFHAWSSPSPTDLYIANINGMLSDGNDNWSIEEFNIISEE